MSSLKFVLGIGAQFIPVVGKALDAGLGMSYCTGPWWLVSPLDNWPPDKETQIWLQLPLKWLPIYILRKKILRVRFRGGLHPVEARN